MEMEKLHKLRDMLIEEVSNNAEGKELTYSCLDVIEKCGECYEIVDKMIKSLEYGEYSYGYPDIHRMRRYNYGYGYEREPDNRDHIISQLNMSMSEATNERERRIISQAIEQLRNM